MGCCGKDDEDATKKEGANACRTRACKPPFQEYSFGPAVFGQCRPQKDTKGAYPCSGIVNRQLRVGLMCGVGRFGGL